jgi:hypothetical protein
MSIWIKLAINRSMFSAGHPIKEAVVDVDPARIDCEIVIAFCNRDLPGPQAAIHL